MRTAALYSWASWSPGQMRVDELTELQGVPLDYLKRSAGWKATHLLRVPGHQPKSLTVASHLHPLRVVCCAEMPTARMSLWEVRKVPRDTHAFQN